MCTNTFSDMDNYIDQSMCHTQVKTVIYDNLKIF